MNGLLLTAVLVVAVTAWLWRRASLRRRERLGLACPNCGLDLRPYPGTYTCPRCYERIEHPHMRPANRRDDGEEDDEPDEDDDPDEDAERW